MHEDLFRVVMNALSKASCLLRRENLVILANRKIFFGYYVHLEKTFFCVTMSKQYPVRKIL